MERLDDRFTAYWVGEGPRGGRACSRTHYFLNGRTLCRAIVPENVDLCIGSPNWPAFGVDCKRCRKITKEMLLEHR